MIYINSCKTALFSSDIMFYGVALISEYTNIQGVPKKSVFNFDFEPVLTISNKFLVH